MHKLQFTAETSSAGILERDFALGAITGVLWSPAAEHTALVLMGHGGGLHKKAPGLVARARDTVTSSGFTVVAIDAPGHGERPRRAVDDQARTDIREAVMAGDNKRFEEVSIRYSTGLAEQAVPEWQEVLDALQELPEIGPAAPIGYGGGISLGTAIGIPLTAADPGSPPRSSAAGSSPIRR
ncbi:alpha/beta fold hydrolase [Paractinoplanes durhamensis]|uniref:hypothetical protein n=1 Tax=Paractinoplanes durhamensis TaxID=113563 RepID=UPI003634B844